MIYLAGYILASFLTMSGLAWAFSTLHRRSSLSAKVLTAKKPPSIRAHALISFSVILPFSALAFLLLILAAMKMGTTNEWVPKLLPTGGFLLGYFYFKKLVGS